MKKLWLAILLALPTVTYAGELMTMSPWVKAVPPSAKMSAAYLHIHNETNKDIFLTGASSSYAKVVEIHTHTNDNGVMRMRKIDKLKVPAKGMVELKPKSDHLMFIGLKKKLKMDDKVDIELTFSNGKMLELKAPVKKLDGHSSHNHKH